MNRRIRRKLIAQVPVVTADGRRGPDALERYVRTGDHKLWDRALSVAKDRLAKVGKA